jgi:hypothetical protein
VNETIIAGQTTAAATQTLVMSILGVILAGTVLWRAARIVRGRPRTAARRAAEQRAEGLLAELLGERDYAALLTRGYLDIPSRLAPPGTRVYRVAYPPDGVLLVEHGVAVEHLCILPTAWVPPADVFLTHKALLEGDEEEYLRLAVHTPLEQGMFSATEGA